MRGLDLGLDLRIHLLAKGWISGSSPAMTTEIQHEREVL
jgi:hypothetical protein